MVRNRLPISGIHLREGWIPHRRFNHQIRIPAVYFEGQYLQYKMIESNQNRCHRSGPLPRITNWDVLEFIARVVDHIPEPSQQMTRYWGFYANAARGKRRKKADEGEQASAGSKREDTDDDFTRQARLSWAKLIRRVYEIDPLLCPFCGAEMKILAFITDFATVRAIRRSLKLPAQEPEPLAHGPPHEIELLDQIA
jgi:hypothetical protein